MIGLGISLVALVSAFRGARHSLGRGLAVVLAWGYLFGILRARFPDGFTHFLFDAAVLGLYCARFSRPTTLERLRGREVAPWVFALVAWPCLLFFVPQNHLLIQLVGLRASIFFVPFALLGARLEASDLNELARWLVLFNLLAFVVALGELQLGIEPFFPRNAVSELIYRSNDVGQASSHRIPSTFPTAHAYAGTMVGTLPFLLARWQSVTVPRRDRLLAAAALAASTLGIFLAGARQPVVILFSSLTVLGATSRLRARTVVGTLVLGVVVGWFVAGNERFQRFMTLQDTDATIQRFRGSQQGFFEIALAHPLGEGLGSGMGTSIPFFLAHLAPEPIGNESELTRIAIEQSLFGLALWLAFVVVTGARTFTPASPDWTLGTRFLKIWATLTWASLAVIGVGILTAIPITPILLLAMGLAHRSRIESRLPAPVRPRREAAVA